jgi:hypothetical protein
MKTILTKQYKVLLSVQCFERGFRTIVVFTNHASLSLKKALNCFDVLSVSLSVCLSVSLSANETVNWPELCTKQILF